MFDRVWNFCKDKYVYVVTIALATVMMLGAWIIGEVGPFGGRCLIVVDGVHQYLPFFSEYQEKLKTLSSLQYTFDVGLGNNFLSLWAYYLSSPFNLIIILFGKTHLPMLINVIITLKIILAAGCFAYFLMHMGKRPVKNSGIIVFSLLYAFSSFVVGYYWNLMWLDCVYIFPIVILGMDKMLRKNDSRLYILSLAYCFICNYYISFMICIFLVLWFFGYHFSSFTRLVYRGIRFTYSSLTAAALSAIVLLPAYKGIMTTASAKFSLPDWKFYGSFADTLKSHLFCSEVMTNQIGDGGTNLYCGVFTILLAIMFFFIGDIALEKKIKYGLILVLMVISFNNQLPNYIWHGFHNQFGIPNRFAFLYIFVLLLMAYEVFLKRKAIRLPMVIVSYVFSMLFVIFCYYHADTTYDNITYIATAIFLSIYMLLFALYCKLPGKKWIARYALVFFAILEMAINGWYGFKQVGSSEQEYYYGATKDIVALKDIVEDAEGKDSFYRSDILQPLFVDEATWYNLKSIGIFGSTVRGELVDVMGTLGFYTGANEYLYYGATPVTNALFGVKYVYTRKDDFNNTGMDLYTANEEASIYKNYDALPPGYMVDDKILDYDPENNGPFTVQNEVCGALTGIEPIFTTIYDDMQMEVYGTNVTATKVDDNNAKYEGANDSAKIDMIYKVPSDMDLYVNCRGTNVYKIALMIDGTEVAYDRYQGQLFHIGKLQKGQLVDVQFEINDGKDQKGELYCYPMEFVQSQYNSFYNVMLNNSMEVTKAKDTKIEGKISVKKDGVFMTSIPYDEGWSIYANDEKLETFPILDSFLGTKLPQGDYVIKMKYRCPGLIPGALITFLGVICFILICNLEEVRRQRRRIKREQEKYIKEEPENGEK